MATETTSRSVLNLTPVIDLTDPAAPVTPKPKGPRPILFGTVTAVRGVSDAGQNTFLLTVVATGGFDINCLMGEADIPVVIFHR
jgi:hypothetical protein